MAMKLFVRATVFAVAVSALLPATASAQLEPIRTRRSEFRIPFTFSQEDYAKIGAQEVQLFLSLDRGNTWQHVQSALPTAQKFRYRAGSDGEHWFAVRTLDRAGRLQPLGQLSPGLIVLVDTRKPRLSLDVSERAGEGVTVRWRVTDADLKTRSLRIEYRHDRSDEWQTARFEPAANGQFDVSLERLGVDADAEVTFRLGVEDRAGNVAVTSKSLRLRGVVLLPEPEADLPPAASTQRTPTLSAGASGVATEARPVSMRTARSVEKRSAAGAKAMDITPFETVEQAEAQPTVSEPAAPAQAVPAHPTVRVSPKVTRSASHRTVVTPAGAPAVAPREEPVIEQYGPSMPKTEAKPEPEPKTDQPRVVNKKEFLLGYSIDDLGTSGVGSVEVFITENDGKKWWRYGFDADKKSPFVVRVPRDGKYGLSVAARSGAGLGGTPPSPGDAPQVVIVVDQSAPKGRIESVEMTENRTLRIRWQADDPNPGESPIQLEYAAKAQGPWLPVEKWQPNTGELLWSVPSAVPARVHLRMRMRDAAGNESVALYPDAVLVDTSRPRVRITNVQVSGAK